MAVPKRKTSPSKRGMRRANQGLYSVNYTTCIKCNAKKLSHFVCQKCGVYNDMQVINVKTIAKKSEIQEDA